MSDSLYCLYDKVADRFSHFMLASSDGMYVRELVAHRIAFPLNFRDTEVYCLGEFKHDERYTLDSNIIGLRHISWDAWKAPENTAELLAPLGLSPEETARISREKIETQIEDLRSKNKPIPQSLTDELQLYTRR